MKQIGFIFIIIGLILILIQCTSIKEVSKKSIFDYTDEELDQMSDSTFLQLITPDSTLRNKYKPDTSIQLLLYPKKVIVENMEEEFYLFREIKNTGNKKQKFRFSGPSIFSTCILQNNNESFSYPNWFSVKEKG